MKNSTEKELLLLLHTKIDSVQGDIKNIEVIQSKHEANLTEHMRRSESAEHRLEIIEADVKPILQGLSFLKVVAKVGTTITSLIYALSKFLS